MADHPLSAVVRDWFEGVNRADVTMLDRLCTPDYRLHFGGVPDPLTLDAAKGVFGAFFSAFPGLSHTIEDQIVQGDKAAVRIIVSGTHRGAFQGMPPTGKTISMGAINVFHVVDGRIKEQWIEYDGLGMMQQLGAGPAPS